METFKEIIARRRRGEESPEDFLQSMLQRNSFPASEKLDDSEIMDNLLTLIIAGQTTTAAAMMWSVKFLHDNRDEQDILRVRCCIVFVVVIIKSWTQPNRSRFITSCKYQSYVKQQNYI